MSDLLHTVNLVVDEINDVAEQGYDAMYEYLQDCLDVEFRCNSRREMNSAVFAIGLGGPNIYVDTNGHVNGYWGNDHYERSISSEAEGMIYQIAEDWWNM